MSFKAFLLCLGCFVIAIPSIAQGTANKDHQAINSIIKQFNQAIVNKDKESFLSMFYDGSVSWVGVFSEQTMKHRDEYLAAAPEKEQFVNRKYTTGTPQEFIEGIINNPAASRESFENIKISTDGSVATVHFDYAFYRDDYKSNWGEEGWHLVKTKQGWLINSVIFSMTINPKTIERLLKEFKDK
jgi:hypothetical protein